MNREIRGVAKQRDGCTTGGGGPQTSEWHDQLSFVSVNTWHMPEHNVQFYFSISATLTA
jgi:hypothetical protein